jgi:hypothetical protein
VAKVGGEGLAGEVLRLRVVAVQLPGRLDARPDDTGGEVPPLGQEGIRNAGAIRVPTPLRPDYRMSHPGTEVVIGQRDCARDDGPVKDGVEFFWSHRPCMARKGRFIPLVDDAPGERLPSLPRCGHQAIHPRIEGFTPVPLYRLAAQNVEDGFVIAENVEVIPDAVEAGVILTRDAFKALGPPAPTR